MLNHKISVIIPVYNAEKTIGNILNKLISQEYQNIEIFAINDGSEDSSVNILKCFASKDDRIVVIDQENAGVSTARNVGIKNATGEFIIFIDSDDDIDDKLIIELANRITDRSDFIMCGMNINDNEVMASDIYIEDSKSIAIYILKSMITKNLLYGPCCKLFRRNIIIKNGLLFPDEIKYGEDTIFVLAYLKHSRSLQNIKKSLYLYNFSTEGLASNNNNVKHFRQSRTRALNEYMKNKYSLSNFIIYMILRARWTMASIKSNYKASRHE